MGNGQSSDSRPRAASSAHANASTPSSSPSHHHTNHAAKNSHDLHHSSSRTKREPRRRESIQAALGLAPPIDRAAKAPPVAPAASTATAELFKTSSGQHSAASDGGSSPRSSPTAARAYHAASRSEAWLPHETQLQADDGSATMGNEQSRPGTAPAAKDGAALSRQTTKEHGASGTLSRQTTKEAAQTPPQPQPQAQSPAQAQTPPQPVGPVDVPSGHAQHGHHEDEPPMSPFSPTQSASYSMPVSAGFSRPPRLPLPIEEEEYVPGSPVLSPADLQDAVEPLGHGGPQRSRSMLSGTTVDDEVDEMEEGGLVGEAQGPSVPTLIEWRGPGEKIYVTGTFAAWDRKYRLHKDGPSKHGDALSVTINLQPGTHHLKFIVDGDMRLSDQLPTAVDYTNILVNYIEVSADDRPSHLTSAIQAPGAPVIPPGTEPVAVRPPPTTAGATATSSSDPKTELPSHVRAPQALPATQEIRNESSPRPSTPAKTASGTTATETGDKPPTKTASGRTEHRNERMATKYYHNVVPKFLLDGDQPEDTPAHRNADAVCDTLPTPPTLPLFLSKSVLNGAMPMKDDASVLIMPNHTVLNHLATSSIRGGTLATSATTRYKQKFLTTVIYKPTSDSGD